MQARRHTMKWLAGIGLALMAATASAQTDAPYPNKPVRIIVPFSAGGGTDLMARTIAQKLTEVWRSSVIVENRAGAGGIIGADAVAKAPADGYTVLIASTSTAINASLVAKPPYDMRRDLQPVSVLITYPLIAVVQASSPVRSLQELVSNSRKSPLNAATAGTGTPQHLVLEMFKAATGAALNGIPYKGGGPAVAGLLGAQTDFMFSLSSELLPHIKAGKLRALAVTSDTRLALLPEIATTTELGFPAVATTGWNGLMVPTGTSRDIIAKMHADVTRIMADEAMKARQVEIGNLPVTLSVAETAAFIEIDVERWRKVIRDANIKPD